MTDAQNPPADEPSGDPPVDPTAPTLFDPPGGAGPPGEPPPSDVHVRLHGRPSTPLAGLSRTDDEVALFPVAAYCALPGLSLHALIDVISAFDGVPRRARAPESPLSSGARYSLHSGCAAQSAQMQLSL